MGYTVDGVIEPAVFSDPAMEKAIRETLGVSESHIIYTNVLWSISEFTVPESAKNLDDLTLLSRLTSLTIQNQKLDSLEGLSSLSKLEKLNLTGSNFPAEELAVIAKLPSLRELNLSNCGLSTIAAFPDSAERTGRSDR